MSSLHIIDFHDDGSVYQDKDWAALNAPGFKYGSGGSKAQDQPTTSLLTDKLPGFLNHYSTTGVEEDKAEIFANLMVDFEYVQLRAEQDPVLKAKVERMKALLAAFCPAMNDDLWKKVRETKRPHYPDGRPEATLRLDAHDRALCSSTATGRINAIFMGARSPGLRGRWTLLSPLQRRGTKTAYQEDCCGGVRCGVTGMEYRSK